MRDIVAARDLAQRLSVDIASTERFAFLVFRYGTETTVLEWRDRLVCSRCGGREVDFVATGERR